MFQEGSSLGVWTLKLFSVQIDGKTSEASITQSTYICWTIGNEHKLRNMKFHLELFFHLENTFFLSVVRHWHMLPGEAVESPSMDIVKTQLDMVLDSLFQLDMLEWGIGLGGFKKFLLPPKSSVILC